MPPPPTSRTADRPSATRPSAARRLTLEEIVDEASAIVTEDGFGALSMRRLADRCGVGAMTLYGYVRTKDELVAALAARRMEGIEIPAADDGATWQDRVAAIARGVRRVLLEHPELLPVIANRRVQATVAYRGAEALFAALTDAGLDDDRIVEAFDAITSYVVGATQREVGLRERGDDLLPGIRELPPGEFTHVPRLAGPLATRDPARAFEAGIDLLILGLDRWRTR
ncbi:MAG: TetR/AcrR family transcriptional regulator [Solirubrobacteraceae bacterium]|nr:TetR/AcrR family transcriptional regulator [Solirubrobacteraceae bacterium]